MLLLSTTKPRLFSALLPLVVAATSCADDDTETGSDTGTGGGVTTTSTTGGGGQGGSGQGGTGQGGSGQGGSDPATAVEVRAGYRHTCLRMSDGGVRCWGMQGVIGDGGGHGLDPVTTPQSVVGVTDAAGLATGDDHSCVLNNSGELACWGWGDVGDGTSDSHELATPLLSLTDVVAVGIGSGHRCASTTSGVFCWGNNAWGQAAEPENIHPLSPDPVTDGSVPIASADELALGDGFSCARQGGTVLCWGHNSRYQVGASFGSTATPTPTEAFSTSGATAIAAGGSHACAIIGTSLTCWGDNRRGQLAMAPSELSLPTALAAPTGVVSVALGFNHSCAVLSNGTVQCWGDNTEGQLGTGTASPDPSPTPAAVSGLSGVVALSAGEAHTCAITSDDALWCWGLNDFGQLGDGTTDDAATPQPIAY